MSRLLCVRPGHVVYQYNKYESKYNMLDMGKSGDGQRPGIRRGLVRVHGVRARCLFLAHQYKISRRRTMPEDSNIIHLVYL
jgi:hypothetical protein